MWKKSETAEDRALYCIAKRNTRQAVVVAQPDEENALLPWNVIDSGFEQ